jgi:hypothetical protein
MELLAEPKVAVDEGLVMVGSVRRFSTTPAPADLPNAGQLDCVGKRATSELQRQDKQKAAPPESGVAALADLGLPAAPPKHALACPGSDIGGERYAVSAVDPPLRDEDVTHQPSPDRDRQGPCVEAGDSPLAQGHRFVPVEVDGALSVTAVRRRGLRWCRNGQADSGHQAQSNQKCRELATEGFGDSLALRESDFAVSLCCFHDCLHFFDCRLDHPSSRTTLHISLCRCEEIFILI